MERHLVILTEGNTDQHFIAAWFKRHYGAEEVDGQKTKGEKNEWNNIQKYHFSYQTQNWVLEIEAIGACTKLKGSLEKREIERLKGDFTLAVVMDADYRKTETQSETGHGGIDNAKKKLAELNTSALGFFWPDGTRDGEIEDLLHAIHCYPALFKCTENFKACLAELKNSEEGEPIKRLLDLKTQIYHYLSHLGHKNKEYQFPQDGKGFDLDHEALGSFRRFIEGVLERGNSSEV